MSEYRSAGTLRSGDHRPKLEEAKDPAVEPNPLLPVENRTGGIQLDQEGGEKEERGENRQETERYDYSLSMFDRSMYGGLTEPLFKEKPAWLQIFIDDDLFLDFFVKGGPFLNTDVGCLELE